MEKKYFNSKIPQRILNIYPALPADRLTHGHPVPVQCLKGSLF